MKVLKAMALSAVAFIAGWAFGSSKKSGGEK